MRFVAVKTVEQQELLAMHRARQGFVAARTAQANQIRGLLSEYGVVIPRGIGCLEQQMPHVLGDAENGLSGLSRELFSRLFQHFRELDRQMKELEQRIRGWHRESTASQQGRERTSSSSAMSTGLVKSVMRP